MSLRCTLSGLPFLAGFVMPGSASAQVAADLIAPVVEYHAHMLSPVTARMAAEPLLPAIELPAALSDLLKKREKAWNDSSAIAQLYTPASVALNLGNGDLPSWIRGQPAVAAYMSTLFARPHRITPVAFHIDGSAAYIAGYFTRDVPTGLRHFGHVLLSLTKGSDGTWRIASEAPTFPGPLVVEPVTAEQLVAQLDEAGIQRAVVLSNAYWFGSAFSSPQNDEYAKVRAENDWIAGEVAKAPQRLIGFCSFNPLRNYALEELERCGKNPLFKGIKLHFGNSGVDLAGKTDHVERLRKVFRTANDRRLAIAVHLWTGPEYEQQGRQYSEIFLNRLLAEATDIPVQIAHMAGGGRSTDSALLVFATAIAAGDPRTKNLYFDVATLTAGQTPERLRQDAARMRQIGFNRILFGSDLSPPNPPARQSWATFRALVPLSDHEFRAIAANVVPYR